MAESDAATKLRFQLGTENGLRPFWRSAEKKIIESTSKFIQTEALR